MISAELSRTTHPKVYIIHENDAWVVPLHAALDALEVPHDDLFVDEGLVDFAQAPPPGVYYNRMSASSHTRDHRYAIELTDVLLAWLESHGRRVINSRASLALERSKVAQYTALARFEIPTPVTRAAVGNQAILAAAREFDGPFVLKPNRGGKGLGVALYRNVKSLAAALAAGDVPAPIDGVSLVQEYIAAANPTITRMEFIGGDFFYAVRVDTSAGFELCPADVCAPDDAVCATPQTAAARFAIIPEFRHPLIDKCRAFLAAYNAQIAGIEFIEDALGRAFVYDVNFNTNYNADAEVTSTRRGMEGMAAYLGAELATLTLSDQARTMGVR
ncbi:MAG: ATP-grasp domain-containing protein [Vulcanimicrobiaceae bacterium]